MKNAESTTGEENKAGIESEDGIEGGITEVLSHIKVYESDTLVCYEDRIFKRFSYAEDNVNNVTAIVQGMLKRCPTLENIYVMPIPSRVMLEEGYSGDTEMYAAYIEQLKKHLPKNGVVINALPELMAHRDEYIFFRAEDSWTSRGAYYGVKSLFSVIGTEIKTLEQYNEYVYGTFAGGLKGHSELAHILNLNVPDDENYYYMLQGSDNMVEVIALDDDGTEVTYKKPLITPSSANLASYINGSFNRAIVEGGSKESVSGGKHLLVICDSAGKVVVPFLKDYYDGIYVVNVREDYTLYDDLNEIVAKYNISDVVYAQNSLELGVKGYYRALSAFCEEE